MGDHLSPKPLSIAERFRFHKRKQLEGESINDYVAVLAFFNVKPASDSNFF
jgi:hypothetical protein